MAKYSYLLLCFVFLFPSCRDNDIKGRWLLMSKSKGKAFELDIINDTTAVMDKKSLFRANYGRYIPEENIVFFYGCCGCGMFDYIKNGDQLTLSNEYDTLIGERIALAYNRYFDFLDEIVIDVSLPNHHGNKLQATVFDDGNLPKTKNIAIGYLNTFIEFRRNNLLIGQNNRGVFDLKDLKFNVTKLVLQTRNTLNIRLFLDEDLPVNDILFFIDELNNVEKKVNIYIAFYSKNGDVKFIRAEQLNLKPNLQYKKILKDFF